MDREDQEDLLSAVIDSSGVDTNQVRFPTAEVMGDIFSFALNTGRSVPQVIADKYKRFHPLTNQIELHSKEIRGEKEARERGGFR